ncbi:MAG TPA: hypothetical protein VFO29_06105 [Candidatus Rubrimentiphilum sp.]|nr:hypothetical protein [Candidatus Rubrimentiphilum sp.]
MNNDSTLRAIDALARRMIGRIWNNLPEERRSKSQLQEEVLQFASRAAANFSPGQNPYDALRATYPNVGRPWKKTDDEELRRLFAAGNSVEDIMLLFGRTQKGVRLRLVRLGLITDEPRVAA